MVVVVFFLPVRSLLSNIARGPKPGVLEVDRPAAQLHHQGGSFFPCCLLPFLDLLMVLDGCHGSLKKKIHEYFILQKYPESLEEGEMRSC